MLGISWQITKVVKVVVGSLNETVMKINQSVFVHLYTTVLIIRTLQLLGNLFQLKIPHHHVKVIFKTSLISFPSFFFVSI